MESTFISIHDLSLDARLLYVSTSIEDILGYQPNEVVGKSCWEYFHPDEIPFAQAIHGRSIQLDKAAVLNYCQIKNKDGRWVGCECVFTVVHDCLVASTSVYRRGKRSQKRAKDAPVIRQLFSSSPRDPRYHMLQYISSKFSQKIEPKLHEARAALFLNRFSRTLTIMYATNGLADLLGITNDQLTGKSFYYCIQENCLREAVKCLESAKANDSIAYLRFWFRDPRQDDFRIDGDEHMSDAHSSGDEDDGGVNLAELMDHDGSDNAVSTGSSNSTRSSVEREARNGHLRDPNPRSSSGNSTDTDGHTNDAIFDRPEGGQQSRTSSISTPDEPRSSREPWSPRPSQVELEAVVSCTSDGLVVVLRRARPFVPQITAPTMESPKHSYVNGLFASPWANDPILPEIQRRSNPQPNGVQPMHAPLNPTSQQANTAATHGPASEEFMNSIREVAVFAWSLTGINGSLAQYSRGTPSGESQPETLQVWDPRGSARHEKERQLDCNSRNSIQYNGSQPVQQSKANGMASYDQHAYSYATGLPNNNYHHTWQTNNRETNGYVIHGVANVSMHTNSQMDGPSEPSMTTHTNGHFGSNPHSMQTNGWNGSLHESRPSLFERQHPACDTRNTPDQSHDHWMSR